MPLGHRSVRLPRLTAVYGVDFSGARLAGRTTWVAHLVVADAAAVPRLVALDRLDRLAGTAERGPALAHLVAMVRGTVDALWAFDCPFGLPVELMPPRAGWAAQRRLVREWGDDAYGLRLECVRRAGVRRSAARAAADGRRGAGAVRPVPRPHPREWTSVLY